MRGPSIALGLALLIAIGRAAGQQTETAEAHVSKGYDALKQDQYDLAANEFQQALKLDPTLVQRARFPLGVAYFEMHKAEDARRELEAVRKEAGDHPNIDYYLGRLDLDERNFTGAIANLLKAATKPPFPDTAYYLGFAYFKQGKNLDKAERWLKQATSATPQDSRVQYQLGALYRQEGRANDARIAVAKSSELRKHEMTDSQLRSECVQKLDEGPRQEAHALCDQLYDPDNLDKLTALGTIYGQHGDLEAALKPLRRAAELAPQSPQTQYNLALTYSQLGQFENARVALAGAIARWPDLFPVNALYGAALYKLGQFSAAYPVLRHAHELNADDAATLQLLYSAAFELALKNQRTGAYPEALRYFREAAGLRPDQAEPHDRMAEVYAATGAAERATAEREVAQRLKK